MRHTFRATVPGVPQPGSVVTLDADDAHHLVRVARRGEGDGTEVIDADGRVWPGVIRTVAPAVTVELGAEPRPAVASLPIDLYVGAMEWGRLDLIVEKCTEIGIASITVFTSERMGRRIDQEGFDRRSERLGRLVAAAAKQSGTGRRPRLRGLVPFPAVIAETAALGPIVLDRTGTTTLGAIVGKDAGRVVLVVGPDAGFSPAELDAARAAGARVAILGDATLRAETAALVAVAIAGDRLAEREVG